MKCVNEKCKKDPLKSLNFKVVNIDGDLACCTECENEYKKQRYDCAKFLVDFCMDNKIEMPQINLINNFYKFIGSEKICTGSFDYKKLII